MNLNDYLSVLDTERFGFKIAKVNSFISEPKTIIAFLKEQGVKLILSKVSTEDITLINQLEYLGFEMKDIQVTYQYLLGKQALKPLHNHTWQIDAVEKKDIATLQSIALESFKGYGHYANNTLLDQQKCNEIYGDWILRSCENSQVADIVLVAKDADTVAGFLSFKIYETGKQKYAAGGIGAVASSYRGKQVFAALIHAGLQWGQKNDLDWEEHNVLINNYPVNQSFVKAGFGISKSFITLHHWI